jgi:hypothetical protein
MTIFVDAIPDRPSRRTGAITCHLWASTLPELLATADRLGIPRRYARGETRTYFHVGRHTREQALGLGAVLRRMP